MEQWLFLKKEYKASVIIRGKTEAIRLLVVIKLIEYQSFKLSHFETLKRNVTYSLSQT